MMHDPDAGAAVDLLSKKLTDWESELIAAHSENISTAQSDAQKAGHAAEGIWRQVAVQILPPGYRVLSRKYIGTEVDLVILPPSAPAFYDEARVTDIPPNIASAVIHVKNTLNRAALRDAMERVHRANRNQRQYCSTAAREREGLPSAIVALGSEWKGQFDSARAAFSDILAQELIPAHPSQIPGFIGTPNWDINNLTIDMPAIHGRTAMPYQTAELRWACNHVVKLVASKSSGQPIHSFAQWLYTSCSASDSSLEPMRVALTQQFALCGTSTPIPFERSAVYSDSRLRT